MSSINPSSLPPISLDINAFTDEKNIPVEANEYISKSQDILTVNAHLRKIHRNRKILAGVYLTVLSAGAFIPASIPVLAVGAIFATVITAAVAIKFYVDAQKQYKIRSDFAEVAFDFEKRIWEQMIFILPHIIRDEYQTTEITETSSSNDYFISPIPRQVKIHYFKENVDRTYVNRRLRNWINDFRFVHAYKAIKKGVLVLPQTIDPQTHEEKHFNHLYAAIVTHFPQELSNIFSEIDEIINNRTRRVSTLVQTIRRLLSNHEDDLRRCPSLSKKLTVKIVHLPSNEETLVVLPTKSGKAEPKPSKPIVEDTSNVAQIS